VDQTLQIPPQVSSFKQSSSSSANQDQAQERRTNQVKAQERRTNQDSRSTSSNQSSC